MIQEVKMYQAVCDGCGKVFVEERGIRTWANRLSAYLAEWMSGWMYFNHCLYCPDCVEYDKETDSYKPKKKE